MNLDTTIFFSVTAIILALFITYIYLVKKGEIKPKTDYRALFILGSALFIMGLAIGNAVLCVVGLAFFATGMINKKKWKDRWRWSKLTPSEKKFKIVIIVFSSALVILGLIIYLTES